MELPIFTLKTFLNQLKDITTLQIFSQTNVYLQSKPKNNILPTKTDPNIIYYTIEKISDIETEVADSKKNRGFSKRYLDISSAVGLASFLYRQGGI